MKEMFIKEINVRKMILVGFSALLLAMSLVFMSCGDSGEDSSDVDVDSNEIVRPDGWTEETHGRDADPNYDVVFPQDRVSRVDITIAPEDWQIMLDDMTEIMGEFGSGGGMGAPGEGMQIPTEALQACDGLGAGDSCTIYMNGMEIAGTCTEVEGESICVPEDMAGPPGVPGGANKSSDVAVDVNEQEREPRDQIGGGNLVSRDPVYRPCTISFEGKIWNYVGIRFKGNSSLRSAWTSGVYKISLRIDTDEFEDDYPEIDNQRFYGFKELSLGSNFKDTSLIREKVAADIFRGAGVEAPQTAFYRVYVDHGEGSVYFGLYTLVEVPRETMLEAQFGAGDGNLYKPEGTGADWQSFNENGFAKKTNEDDEDWSDVEAAIAALHSSRSNPSTWSAGLEEVFDVDGFLRWLAVNAVIQNWDTYGAIAHNYYIYGDPTDNGRLTWIPWDNNESLKSYENEQQEQQQQEQRQQGEPQGEDERIKSMHNPLSLSMDEVGENWPLIRYLQDASVFRSIYVDYVGETIESAFAVESTQARFRAAHEMVEPYVVGADGEIPGHTFLNDPAEFYDELDYLLDHVENRRDAVLDFLAEEN